MEFSLSFVMEFILPLTTEVDELLDKVKITNKQEIKSWYNGYVVGDKTVYNPWSIIQCINNNSKLEPYWVDTANPKIIEDLLINKSSIDHKVKIRNLIKYHKLILEFDLKKHVSFDDLQNKPEMIWSLLIHTGYLTIVNPKDKRLIRLPNKEITLLIKEYIDNWFIEQSVLTKTANSLLMGDLRSLRTNRKK